VLLYALFNIATVLASPLIGKLSDHLGRARLILSSYLIYLTMCLGFAFATTKLEVVVLFVIFGIFYAIDEAQSKAFIADIELDRRGSAIGLYNFVTGVIFMPASLIAGALWLFHPATAFLFAALLAFTAFLVFLFLRPDRNLNNV
jgi:MFS family permease